MYIYSRGTTLDVYLLILRAISNHDDCMFQIYTNLRKTGKRSNFSQKLNFHLTIYVTDENLPCHFVSKH